MKYISASQMASRLEISTQRLSILVKEGRIKPAPVKLGNKRNSPWMFVEGAKLAKCNNL